MQPAAISGAVEKPNSSAPSSAPITTSRPGAQPAVDLHGDAAAQPVGHQRLVRLGKSDFPRRAGMLERGQRRGAGAALEARDRHMVGARLRDAGRDRADADFRDELHRHVGRRVGVLQVVDELRQVLDRIDVVVRRRRDQADARRRVAHLGDGRVDLVAGQLPAFAGLRALRHLDLHHVGVDEIFGRDAEAARGDLLDRRAHRVAVRQRLEAVGFLAALAGVRLAADAVHGDRERGVRLARDRAVGHRAGREALDDLLGGLDLLERHRLAAVFLRGLDAEQAADGQHALGLLVEDLGEGAVLVARVAAHGVLQRRDRLGRPGMRLAAHAEQIFAADLERVLEHRHVAERIAMAAARSPRRSASSPTPSMRVAVPKKNSPTKSLFRPDRVEDLRAAIRLVGRDAHLGHHLEDALVDRLDVALDDLLVVELLRHLVLHGDRASRRRDRG